MRLNRILLSTPLVVVALVIQVSVLARLQLPGAVPDLLLLIVLGLALIYGHVGGCLVGFFAGLLADLAPPADHAVGRYALVLCVIGYVAGLTKPDGGQHRSATVPLLVVDRRRHRLHAAVRRRRRARRRHRRPARRPGQAAAHAPPLYDLLLAPFIVPLVMALARRTDHDPLAGDGSGSASGSAGGRDSAYGWLTTGTGLQGQPRRHEVQPRPRAQGPASAASAADCSASRPATRWAASRGSSVCDAPTASPRTTTASMEAHARHEQHSREPDLPGHHPARRPPDPGVLPAADPRRPAVVPADPQRPGVRQGGRRATTSSRSSSPPCAARSSTRAGCRSPTTRPGWSSPPAAPTC